MRFNKHPQPTFFYKQPADVMLRVPVSDVVIKNNDSVGSASLTSTRSIMRRVIKRWWFFNIANFYSTAKYTLNEYLDKKKFGKGIIAHILLIPIPLSFFA